MNELDWSKKLWHFLEANQISLAIGRERQLWDKTRVDVLTDNFAIEVDWAKKWTEAIGQAAWYSVNTNRQAGICLLVEDFEVDKKYIYRAMTVAERYKMVVWLIDTKKSILIDNKSYTHAI